MNKEDHFIDTDKLGDVLLEFSKKISRYNRLNIHGAGSGNRTHVISLEG